MERDMGENGSVDEKGSGGYASRLSAYPHKGVCGLPELEDRGRVLERKMKKLIELCDEARLHGGGVVVLTGAGISTASGIPDFRGPQGVWTLEQEKKKKKKRGKKRKLGGGDAKIMSFDQAKPSAAHAILKQLCDVGLVRHVVTQNVDGLHQRSGINRSKLSILHGCVFEEQCEVCGKLVFSDIEVQSVSFKLTGNVCPECDGAMRDTLLDWEDALPENELAVAEAETAKAFLAITLGTSLRIQPAAKIHRFAAHSVIVNLQRTPEDEEADLCIRSRCDDVMQRIADVFLPPKSEKLVN